MAPHRDHAHEEHGHDHHHGAPGHVHAPADFGKAFVIGIALNSALVAAEGIFGYLGNSTALMADAGHNLGDVLGLVVAWSASIAARRAPGGRFTYGLRRTSILAALANAIFLLVATGAISLEAVERLRSPEPVSGSIVMIVAAIGILINGATAMLFASGRKGDINIRGAFIHMAGDAAVSAGVVISAALIMLTDWLWLDPLTSLLICAAILWSTWGLLRASIDLSLDAVPLGTDLEAVRQFLLERPGVSKVHDLHVWPISTTETAMTCHVVMPGGHPGDDFLMESARLLRSSFRIGHSTLQIEVDENNACALAPDNVV